MKRHLSDSRLVKVLNRISLFRRATPEQKRAKEFLAAVDKGGIPTIPGRVRIIAHDLGLEVRSSEPIEVTVARIRKALNR